MPECVASGLVRAAVMHVDGKPVRRWAEHDSYRMLHNIDSTRALLGSAPRVSLR